MSYSDFRLVEVRDIGPDHRALYAAADIPAGTFLGFYDGRAAVADLGPDGTGKDLDEFFWRQSVHLRRDGNTLYYLIPFEEPGGIDFLNHSCRPNARVDQQIYLYTISDIAKGTEITADYRTFNLVAQGISCWCADGKCII